MDTSKLPTELRLEIFFSLESLKDAISLAATSRRMRSIWTEHSDIIYRAVAPRSIEGEKHARKLQLLISGHTKITSNDTSKILQHANFMESIIHQFTEKIVKRTPSFHNLCWSDPYRDHGGKHPRHLTPPERRRFIRTYYQLWSLMLLPSDQWPAAITPLTVKQVYLLREMCFIPLAIGLDLPGPKMQEYFPSDEKWAAYKARKGRKGIYPVYTMYCSEGRRGALGELFMGRLLEHEERMKTLDMGDVHFVDTYPWLLREESRMEGFAGFHLIWDHGKDQVKQYCLGRNGSKFNHYREPTDEDLKYERLQQWADSSEEEEGE